MGLGAKRGQNFSSRTPGGCAGDVPSAGGVQRSRHPWGQHLCQPGHTESLVHRGGSRRRQCVKSWGHVPGFCGSPAVEQGVSGQHQVAAASSTPLCCWRALGPLHGGLGKGAQPGGGLQGLCCSSASWGWQPSSGEALHGLHAVGPLQVTVRDIPEHPNRHVHPSPAASPSPGTVPIGRGSEPPMLHKGAGDPQHSPLVTSVRLLRLAEAPVHLPGGGEVAAAAPQRRHAAEAAAGEAAFLLRGAPSVIAAGVGAPHAAGPGREPGADTRVGWGAGQPQRGGAG